MQQRPPDMKARHDRELAELKERQFAETQAWIAEHNRDAARARKLARLQALADELGVDLNGHTDAAKRTPPSPALKVVPPAPPAQQSNGDNRLVRFTCPGCHKSVAPRGIEDKRQALQRHAKDLPLCEAVLRRTR